MFDRFAIRTKEEQKKIYHSLGENERAAFMLASRLSLESLFLSFFLSFVFCLPSLFTPCFQTTRKTSLPRGPNVNARDFLFTLSGAELVAVCTAILFTIEGTPAVRGKRDVTLFQQGGIRNYGNNGAKLNGNNLSIITCSF